ncbi:2-methoxy-6-polyprenyl-1,4-benzoquinol methylase, mitochondrial [Neocloeon triangulifer]|uniref:2-methoxy-6-polyprenyl-1,4-benzoquinol methylase, mitochondrial n=1 Tax=Neocloeon triangulifer TaxID=2078957 RepID=UPI00286F0A2A|nr:2-methoxy-6-polyprenyl-1,4-benzoquinol methylase, mitochondrial [Neocloeon triangulifer]
MSTLIGKSIFLRTLKCARRTSCHFRKVHQTRAANLEQKNTEKSSGETHFGFQTVKESEKAEKVYEVFEDVASSYDKMNDAMSFGIHRLWKDIFVDRLAPTKPCKILDVAGGTGDIAFRIAKFLGSSDGSGITVCDINQAMLDVGRNRASGLGYTGMEWLQGDAENLSSIADNSFDAYTIAFGIRNVTHIENALSEAYRVLKPGGRFMCLEFSLVQNENLRWLYDQYSFQAIPVMGQLIAGQWKAYQYLVESIRQFPNQEEFASMIERAGFKFVRYENLTFGVVAVHSGHKL